MGEERRTKVLELIKASKTPINGSELSKLMGVSRQVIVQDIALLRANKNDIISTNRGYMLNSIVESTAFTRVFKVTHTDEQIEEELSCIVNLSGQVLDVYVEHDIYGKVSAELNIATIQDIESFMLQMQDNSVIPLKNITNNSHYHTVSAPSEKLLDLIELELQAKGFIV